MIAYSHARRCLQIAALAAGLTLTGLSQAQQSQDKPPAAPRGEKPAPNVQAAPTAVPGRPDIPNAEIASKLRAGLTTRQWRM